MICGFKDTESTGRMFSVIQPNLIPHLSRCRETRRILPETALELWLLKMQHLANR